MEKYIKPNMELKKFYQVDVLTASANGESGSGSDTEPTTKNYDLPYIPIP